MTTKKMLVTGGVLGVLLIGSAAGYYFVDQSKKKQEDAVAKEEASYSLFSFDADTVTKLDIQNEEGYFRMNSSEDGWKITDTDYPYEFILNEYYINVVTSYLSGLKAQNKFQTETDLASYGLDNPVVLTWTENGNEHTLYVGTESATREYYYVMLPEDQTIYCIDPDLGTVLRGGSSCLKSPYMLNYYDVAVTSIKLTRKGETAFDLQKTNYTWELGAPLEDANINTVEINSMLTSLTRIELESFDAMADDSTDLSIYGLDHPGYTLTVTNADGSSTTIDFEDYDPNAGTVHLIYRETGQIASLSTDRAGFLQSTVTELLDRKIVPYRFDDVSHVEADIDDIHFSMEMNAFTDTYIFDGVNVAEKDSSLIQTYRLLFDSFASIGFDELLFDAEPDTEAEATIVFRYTLTDGSEVEMSLVPVDDTIYYAFVNGKFTKLTVRRNEISGSTGVLYYYETLTDYLSE